MSATDSQVLHSINEFRGEFNVFVTKLLGSPDGDAPNGRIPILEASNADHEKRLTRLERFFLMLCGGAALLKAMSWMAESAYHIAEVFHLVHS